MIDSSKMNSITKRAVVFGVSFVFAAQLLPISAFASSNAPTDSEISEMQKEVEDSANQYNTALTNLESINNQINEKQGEIEEINAKLPGQKEKAGKSISTLYKMQQSSPGLIDLVLSATDFNDLISSITYLNSIQNKNMEEVNKLSSLIGTLNSSLSDLQEKQAQAKQQSDAAAVALGNAKKARAAAQAKADAVAKAEAEAEAKAASAAAEEQSEQASESAPDPEPTPAPAPRPPSVDWTQDKKDFVANWAPRIDSYLSGSPLAGTGNTFAAAAWDSGVDPRWSPAISEVESSKGTYCFRSHNAWGWGYCSWSNWTDAINDHVSGLARGYGSSITMAAAQKYCPPNATFWYNRCVQEMSKI